MEDIITLTEITLSGAIIERTVFRNNIKLNVVGTKVTAKVYDYKDEFQEDYNGDILFECGDQVLEVSAVCGIAEITVEVPADMRVIVSTVNNNIGNAEVIING